MKIGILTFACDAGRSGIGQYLIHLLREFQKINDQIDFEIIGHEDELKALLPNTHPFKIHRVSSFWKPPLFNIFWQNIFLPLFCKIHRYDAIFLPAANRRLPVWLPCPSIGTVHDFSSLHIDGKYDPLRDFYIKRVLPFLIRRLTRAISVSESTKRDIVQYARYPADRISVIYHGVDHDLYYPRDKNESQNRICAKYGIRPPYILYISRIEHPGKNHIRLISAFTQMKINNDLPHQLVLAGSDWNRADEVHHVAQESPVFNDILFTGFVSDHDLPDLYCGADLFVFPSLYEGFGMPILEAMACGIPVACSNISSLPEVAGEAALLFNPQNESEINNVILKLLQNDDVYKRVELSGLQKTVLYHWDITAEATLLIIKSIVIDQ